MPNHLDLSLLLFILEGHRYVQIGADKLVELLLLFLFIEFFYLFTKH